MKKSLLILSVVFLLQGCMPAAFVCGAAAGGAVIYDNRLPKTILDDHNITYRAQSKINANRSLKEKAHVSVTTFNHIVLVVGQVPNAELKSKVETIVKSIPNVRIVYNEVNVAKPITDIERANDTWITSKVKTALFAEKGLKSTQIKVVTENGTVYLMGMTTKSQAYIAAEKTSTVVGVHKVVKLFEYI